MHQPKSGGSALPDTQTTDRLKKPYQRPQLDVYGDLREATNTVSMMGNADGAAHGMTKTG
jgi:hypothetical protein